MKKVLISILIVSAFFYSCKKTDKSVFDKSPDERLTETLAAYETQLSGAQNGWKAVIKVDSGKGAAYSFYFKFNDANRVVMLSDFDSLSAVTPKESSYRLKALQQPSLIFDTYSYLHVLSDPDPAVNGQNVGSGLLGDFEFYFDSVSTDSIKLIGRIHGSKLTLVRASQAEEVLFNSGGLASGLGINKILTYFKRLTVGAQSYDIQINPRTRQVIFTWLDGSGAVQTFTTGYYFTADGIGFTDPLVNGSQIISGLSGISWNQGTETINLTADATAGTITGIVTPLKVDVDAPQRWWQYAVSNANGYWISANGFHVNGVDDAYNINSLTSGTDTYYYLIYWPAYGNGYDFFGPVFLDAAQTGLSIYYGSAPSTPQFTSDGRAVFHELGTFGTNPTSGPAALTHDQLYIPSGYYFVQTSATTYDMVSAADGKAWITWEF
ncbi:MAG: DUF4302 domain-containing protein [Ginsengibacter sp.]